MFCPSSTSARVSSSGRPRRKVFFSSFLYSALTLEKSIPPASCTPRVLRTTRTSSVVRGLGSDALTNGEAAKPFEPIMVILSAPMLENWPTTTFCSPSPRDMSATTAVMPMKMPIMVSRLRNLLSRRLFIASLNNSITATIRYQPFFSSILHSVRFLSFNRISFSS